MRNAQENGSVLTIEPTHMHWLAELPAEADLCAHGGVVVRHGGTVLLDDSEQTWSLSAAALFLLRAVEQDHAGEHRVAEHLFPCCGHAMYAQNDSDDVQIVGCPNGRDWDVIHEGEQVVLRFGDGSCIPVSSREWRDAVVAFSQTIEKFYDANAPKKPSDEIEAAGFAAFRAEWSRRLRAARHAA